MSTTTLIRSIYIDPVGEDDDLWEGPEPDSDPHYVDPERVRRALNPNQVGNQDAWQDLTESERDEVVRRARDRWRPLPVTVIAELLHASNTTVEKIVDRLFNPEWTPPPPKRSKPRRAQPYRDRADKRRHMLDRAGIPVLTVRRPWAELIMSGVKTVEIRSWTTNYRGPLLIAAGHRWETHAVDLATRLGVNVAPHDQHPIGILGTVTLADTIKHVTVPCQCGGWGHLPGWHWQITNPEPFSEVLAGWTGKQGLRWPTGDLAQQIEETRRAQS